jgi:hypothetical protein
MLRSEGQEIGWDADQIAGYIGALDKDGRGDGVSVPLPTN